MIAVVMCTARNAKLVSARFRCKAATANRGHSRVANRAAPSAPSTTTPVNNTKDTSPLARLKYHNAGLMTPA